MKGLFPSCSLKAKPIIAMRFAGVAFALTILSSGAVADPFKPAVLAQENAEKILSTKGEESSSVGRVRPGEVFYVEPSDDIWWRVQAYKNQTGFIRRARIKLIEEYQNGIPRKSWMTPADIDSSAEPVGSEVQHILGLKFSRGIGVKIDQVRAAHWFNAAASNGHVGAKADLAMLYFRGEGGLKRDRRLAKSLVADGLAANETRSLLTLSGFLETHADENGDLGTKHRLISQDIAILEEVVARGGEDGARAVFLKIVAIKHRTKIRAAAISRLYDVMAGSGSGERQCPRCAGVGREFTNSGISGMSCHLCGGSGYVDD
jgi:hypothetical protein